MPTTQTHTLRLLLPLCLLLIPTTQAQYVTHPEDVAVMTHIATAYPSTFGALGGWKSNTDPCTSGPINETSYGNPWTGLSCSVANATAEPYFRIYSVALRHVGFKFQDLAGPFPVEIANLQRVASIDLSYNSLTGTLPTQFLSPLLSTLRLNQNNLTGTISPTFLAVATSLTVVDLSLNQLSGPVPMLPGNMTVIRLNNNNFTGQVTDFIPNYDNLVTLVLANNRFTGPLPDFPPYAPVNEIDLNNNFFSGSIPDSISELPLLSVLDLGNNFLTGSIPTFPEAPINYLRLSCNQLSGSIPEELGSISSLRVLKLEVNNLTGSLPTFLESPPAVPSVTSAASIAIYFNGSCNFFAPPLPNWCSIGIDGNTTCTECASAARECFNQFVPYIPGGRPIGNTTSNSTLSSPAERSSRSSLLALLEELLLQLL